MHQTQFFFSAHFWLALESKHAVLQSCDFDSPRPSGHRPNIVRRVRIRTDDNGHSNCSSLCVLHDFNCSFLHHTSTHAMSVEFTGRYLLHYPQPYPMSFLRPICHHNKNRSLVLFVCHFNSAILYHHPAYLLLGAGKNCRVSYINNVKDKWNSRFF